MTNLLVSINDLNQHVKRVGLQTYDRCYIKAFNQDNDKIFIHDIVILSWNAGLTEYYRAGELLNALTNIPDNSNVEFVLDHLPNQIPKNTINIIETILNLKQQLKKAEMELEQAENHNTN